MANSPNSVMKTTMICLVLTFWINVGKTSCTILHTASGYDDGDVYKGWLENIWHAVDEWNSLGVTGIPNDCRIFPL